MKKNREQRTENMVASKSEAETMRIAWQFAKTLGGGEVILLEGELGAGKTTFVRGMASALGVREPIRSPTFTLMRIHHVATALPKKDRSGRTSRDDIEHFVHVDAYRLRSARELAAIGLGEYLGRPDTIVAIEWGRKARSLLRSKRVISIHFQHGKNPDHRQIHFEVI